MENGKVNPGATFFLALESVYNIGVDYLFHGESSGEKSKTAEGIGGIDFEIDSVEDLVNLMNRSKFVRNAVLSFATKFVWENEALIKRILSKPKRE